MQRIFSAATARILADTESVTVIDSDESLDRIEIHFFTNETRQSSFCAYPILDESADYTVDGEPMSGRKLPLAVFRKSLECGRTIGIICMR